MKARTKIIKPADVIAVLLILALAALTALLRGGGRGELKAEIMCAGETLFTINLADESERRVIELDCGVKILVGHNEIGFLESDCAGQQCVNTGLLTKGGECAACIPNRTVIRLKGGGGDSPDAVAG